MIDRRQFLIAAGAGMAAAAVGLRTVFAAAPTEKRFVLVVLRGGLDALHAVPPYGDREYGRLRPTLAVGEASGDDAVLDLDGYFGLHPALSHLHGMYRAKELILLPASATRYRLRSHFDGQNLLENGSGKPYGAPDGWLNRAIIGLDGGGRRLGLALGPAVPLVLQGDARVQTWAQSPLPEVDDDFLRRLNDLYAGDPIFAEALADATGTAKPVLTMNDMQNQSRPDRDFDLAVQATAQFLARVDGPRIAVMEMQGWDTHFGQHWRLRDLLARLSSGVAGLKQGLGPVWTQTSVLIVSEFGRTAAENGSRGTDHGTGGIAMLAGGAVAGGRIAGTWPGLNKRALYEGRDLQPANDYEGIFKAVLIEHLGVAANYVEDKIFPASAQLQPKENLFRKL